MHARQPWGSMCPVASDGVGEEPPPELAGSLEWSLRDWVEYHQRELVVRQVRYRGVPCWKNVMDLWVYQEILWETGVEAVIEIGVMHGGTSLWLADMLRVLVGDRATVVSIDLEAPDHPLPSEVDFLLGDSLDPAIVDAAGRACQGKRTMVIADGNHAADHVLGELRAYGALVSPGCYFIAEDGIVDVMDWKPFTPGPREAVRQFLRETDTFAVDRSREKYVLTYCPEGFLRRQ
jgi:cephalosporin hydroxylase